MSATSIAEKFEVITDAVYEKGQKSEYDKFWDEFQQNGNRTDYISAFGSQWTTEIFKPKYPIRPTAAVNMFYNNAGNFFIVDDFVQFCEENNIIIDFKNCKSSQHALACLHSPHFGVLDFSSATNLSYLFYSHNDGKAYCVKKIDEFISSETTNFHSTTFQTAIYLTDIKMSGIVAKNIDFGACPLNKQSLESVVGVLSTTATGLTATFKKTAVNSAFGVNVDDASTYTDEFNEWRNSRKNWTFNYS